MEFINPSLLNFENVAPIWNEKPENTSARYEEYFASQESASIISSTEDHILMADGREWHTLLRHEPDVFRASTLSGSLYGENDTYFDTPSLLQGSSPVSDSLSSFDCGSTFHDPLSVVEGESRLDQRTKGLEYTDEFVAECLMPLRPIQDDLLMLFFTHVHPMFPILNEYRFMTTYHQHKCSNELMEPDDFVLLLAISFAAFAHVDEYLLSQTSYRSVHEGQKYQFEITKKLYGLQITKDPITLAQVSILLSFWSPCDSESQVNSHWIARAFSHARESLILIKKTQQRDEEDSRTRWKLLWWCCLIRERMLALGMRRPERLLKTTATLTLPNEADFGMDAVLPHYTTISTKRKLIRLFSMLCKLSDVMEDIAIFQRNARFSRQWDIQDLDLDLARQEVGLVVEFECRLKAWKADLDHIFRSRGERQHYMRKWVPMVYVLQIMCDSMLGAIYRPYLCDSTNSTSNPARFSVTALVLVKESSQNVAQSLRKLLRITNLEGIPSYLVAWIALPTAVDYVLHHINGGQSTDNGMKLFLLDLRSRFQSAHFVSLLLEETVKKLSSEIQDAAFFELILYATQLPAYENLYLPDDESTKEPSEAELLNRVANAVDTGLANDIRGLGHNRDHGSDAEIREHVVTLN